MSTDLDPATVLEEAADLLLIHGRCTGVATNDAGQFCVRGALAAAQGLDLNEPHNIMGVGSRPDVKALERYLYAHVDLDRLGIPNAPRYSPDLLTLREQIAKAGAVPAWIWNDRLNTENDDFEVIDTLRLVAKELRNSAEVNGADAGASSATTTEVGH